MKEISKFIPMNGNGEEIAGGIGNLEGSNGEGYSNGTTTAKVGGTDTGVEGTANGDTTFRVCGNPSNLPAKPKGIFSKIKAILFYDIKVELTPYQQKIEDEINDFLHQEVTWQGFKNFLFQDISFSKKGKTRT